MLEKYCVCILHLFISCPEVERELLPAMSIFVCIRASVAV